MADSEEERVLVVGKLHLLGFRIAQQLLQFLQAFRGIRTRFSPLMPSRISFGFST